MRLVTFKEQGETAYGLQVQQGLIDLPRAAAAMPASAPPTLMALLEQGDAGMELAQAVLRFDEEQAAAGQPTPWRASPGAVTWLPPVLNPGKVICLGLNYRSHAAEGHSQPPEYPMLFHKTAGALTGAGMPIVLPRLSQQVDYEGELAVIIGRQGKYIPQAEALSYVAGYACANDVSARDLQRRTGQFTSGKMLDTFGPLGPALVTRDEVPQPNDLAITTTLNGQVMQHSNTRQMIFDVPTIVSYISSIATLYPGDVIFTGTPEGVGFARTPPVWLRPGDVVTVSIERVGVLANPVVAEEPAAA